jgi:hypothetical protein
LRKAIVALALLAVGCSKAAPNEERMADVSQKQAAPELRATLTPGVALSYSYSFRLPAARVASAQEKHAMQCEALGAARCRIVGMSYHVVQTRSAQGTLALKLAPELARGFGKQGAATVTEQGGMLSDAEISSVEAGATIAAANRDDQSITSEQQQIARQLASQTLGDDERVQLQSRQAALADARRAAAGTRAEAAALLASTPVTFYYASGVIDTGFRDGPFIGAVKDGWANVVDGSLIMLKLLITLCPWIVLAAVLAWLWRRFGRRFGMHTPEN